MPENDIYRVVIDGTLHGQVINNVLHFRGTQPISNPTALLNAILDCIRTALLPGIGAQFKLNELRARTIYPAVSDDVVVAAAAGDVGANANDTLPSFGAAVVSIKTGLAGRSNRGRFYLAGIPETGVSQSRMSDAQLALIVAFAVCMANKFISATSLEPYWLGVLSRKGVAAGQTPLAAFKQAATLVVTNVVGTQRRRKIGVGS